LLADRAWQLFDWVRNLPEGHHLQRLCDANTYTTMITLCGPWQQLRRALQLVAEMRTRSLECGIQVRLPAGSACSAAMITAVGGLATIPACAAAPAPAHCRRGGGGVAGSCCGLRDVVAA
jgi:pentatricopeptide repeat protein